MMTLCLIGCGGIGYQIHEQLARLADPATMRLVLIDGKTVGPHNIYRQHTGSAIGRNKAEVLAESVKTIAPNLTVIPIPEYISEETVKTWGWWRDDNMVVFSGVDNNRTRVMLEELLDRRKRAVLISGGNDEFAGQAVLWRRESHKDILPKPSDIDPDILLDLGRAPFEIPCDEVQVSLPQLPLANRLVADAMVMLWWSQVLHTPKKAFNYITFDVRVPHMSTWNRPALRDVGAQNSLTAV